MKLIFAKDNLLNALGTVSKAIPSKTTNPILECILFDASSDSIKLTANDTELGIETVVEGEIVEKGKIALDARLTYEIIRKLEGADQPVTIESSEDLSTVISCADAVFNIQGRDGEEFAYLPYIDRDHYICLTQFTLRETIRQTIISAAMNDTNRMMGGMYIEVNGTNVRFVTLDGHRISIRNIEMKEDYGSAKVIVPGRTMNEISRIIGGDSDKDVLVYFTKNHILFSFDETTVVSRLIEGEYFRIEHMLSHDYETKVTVNKTRFLNSIDRAMILIRENDHKPIVLNIKDESVGLQVRSSFGSMNAEIPCEKEGRDLMIAFNPKFLIDALKVIDDETVDIYMTNAKSPCFIRDGKDSYIYLILPVNFIA